jgi:hypothetical protein
MKPRVSASPPPISVGDDDDDDDGANDAGEEDFVDRTIDRSVGWYASAQYKKGQRGNGVGFGFGLGLGLGLGLGMGNGTGEDTDTSVDSTRPPRPRHPRTTSRSPSSAQSMANSNVNKPNEYAETTRTRSFEEHRQSNRCQLTTAHKTSVIHDDNYTYNSCVCVCNHGIPLVMLREESDARAKAVRPPPKVVSGKPRAPVGELVAYFE